MPLSFFSINAAYSFFGYIIIVLFFFCFFIKLISDISCDSKLIPILITLSENSGDIFEGDIKTISLYFLTSENS